MASLLDAQRILRGLNVDVSELDDDRFSVDKPSQKFSIRKEDVDRYLSLESTILRNEETEIFYNRHFEHAITLEGAPYMRSSRFSEEELKLTSNDEKSSVSINKFPSIIFLLHQSNVDSMHRDLRRYTLGARSHRSDQEEIPCITNIVRLKTISVNQNSNEVPPFDSKKMRGIAESSIFHFAYGRGMAISLPRSWERTYFNLGRGRRDEPLQFPLRYYNSDLIGYYSLAYGTESIVLAYIALYNILEHFYTSVSENALHKKLRDELASPDFSYNKIVKMRSLVKIVDRNYQKTDELSSLKLVLSHHFDTAEIIDWIDNLDESIKNYFLSENDVFGKKYQIDISEAGVFGSISKRIYNIRNALVHNKEGEISKFVPYSGQEDFLQHEILLIRMIAEMLIIKTGKEI